MSRIRELAHRAGVFGGKSSTAALRDRAGAAVVEFALLAPIMLVLMCGVVDYGRGFVAKKQLTAATEAGAAYTIGNGFDATAIGNAVAGGGTAGITSYPAATQFCGCPDALGGVTTANGTPPDCTGTCLSGGTPGTYVKINAQMPFNNLFAWPGMAKSITLTSTSTVRIK